MPDIRRQKTISQEREDTAQQVLESAQRTLTEEGPGQGPNRGPALPTMGGFLFFSPRKEGSLLNTLKWTLCGEVYLEVESPKCHIGSPPTKMKQCSVASRLCPKTQGLTRLPQPPSRKWGPPDIWEMPVPWKNDHRSNRDDLENERKPKMNSN